MDRTLISCVKNENSIFSPGSYIDRINGYKLTVDCSSSKRSVSIQIRLAIELVFLIGKVFPCRGKRCRIEAGLARYKEKLLRAR